MRQSILFKKFEEKFTIILAQVRTDPACIYSLPDGVHFSHLTAREAARGYLFNAGNPALCEFVLQTRDAAARSTDLCKNSTAGQNAEE